jgi:hypothetical protein
VGLERCPLTLVNRIEKLLGRKCNGSSLESREYGLWDPLRSPRDTLYAEKLALASPTSVGRSVGIAFSRNKVKEIVFVCSLLKCAPSLRELKFLWPHIPGEVECSNVPVLMLLYFVFRRAASVQGLILEQ